MAGTDDFELTLAAAQRGDERAAAQLFRAYQPMLLRYAQSQDRRAADDITAEVWLAAVGSIREFVGDETGFRSWLFTVARRRITDHLRRSTRQRTDSVDPETFVSTASEDDPAARASESADAGQAIDVIVEHLSAEQAEVVILRIVADLSAAQVGELMGREEGWVRLTQHRALKRLAQRLDARMEIVR